MPHPRHRQGPAPHPVTPLMPPRPRSCAPALSRSAGEWSQTAATHSHSPADQEGLPCLIRRISSCRANSRRFSSITDMGRLAAATAFSALRSAARAVALVPHTLWTGLPRASPCPWLSPSGSRPSRRTTMVPSSAHRAPRRARMHHRGHGSAAQEREPVSVRAIGASSGSGSLSSHSSEDDPDPEPVARACPQ